MHDAVTKITSVSTTVFRSIILFPLSKYRGSYRGKIILRDNFSLEMHNNICDFKTYITGCIFLIKSQAIITILRIIKHNELSKQLSTEYLTR